MSKQIIKFATYSRSTALIKSRLEAILTSLKTLEAAITDVPISLAQTRALSAHFSEAKKKFANYESTLQKVLELDSMEAPETVLLADQNSISELFLQISVLVDTLKPIEEVTTPSTPTLEPKH